MSEHGLLAGYQDLLQRLKEQVRTARNRAAVSVNRELVLLYWRFGREILIRQERGGWGARVIDRLAADLPRAFPGRSGFSARNIKYMRRLAEAWPDEAIVQQLVAQLPWGHNLRLLDLLPDPGERNWYARAAIEHGWSRAVMVAQIETRLIDRRGQVPSNFARTLPHPKSELAQQILKDPYSSEFLVLPEDAGERELQAALLDRLTELMLELGQGFAYVGRQVPVEVAGDTYRLDLLFYHIRLRCYVVIELKNGDFRPEYAGKLNYYLSAADDLIRDPASDGPTLGILLCRSRKNLIVEYALRGIGQPIGVAGLKLSSRLPEDLRGKLPTAAELTHELEQRFGEG